MDLTLLPNAFSHRLARQCGLSDRSLRRFVASGAIERLSHGIYRKADAPPVDLDHVEIALRAPEATLCLTTALSLHDLTDIVPARIDVALPRSQRQPRVSAPVQWHRFHEETYDIGRESFSVEDGLALGIYSAERCIIDAFRLRHTEGEDVALEALKRWLPRAGSSPASLLEMAKQIPKAEPSLLTALRILL